MQKGLEEVVGLDSGIGPAVHEVVLALMPLAVGSLLRARRRLQNTSPAPRRASLTPKTGEQGAKGTPVRDRHWQASQGEAGRTLRRCPSPVVWDQGVFGSTR